MLGSNSFKQSKTNKNYPISPYLIILSILVVFSNQENCTQITNKTGNSSLNCSMLYTTPCKTNDYQFVRCELDQCFTTNKDPCNASRKKIFNQTQCISKCFLTSSFSDSSSQWLQIMVVVFLVVFLIIVCACVIHKCRNPPQPRNLHIIYIVPLEQIGTQRRLSENQNITQFEPNWVNCQSNSKWPPSEQACIICLQSNQTAVLSCEHYFHALCIKEWLRIRRNCPTCKNDQVIRVKILCKICKTKELSFTINQFFGLRINQACTDCFLNIDA